MEHPTEVQVRVARPRALKWKAVTAVIDSRAPCRTVSLEFLANTLEESDRLNKDIGGETTCRHHQDFVGKVRLRIEGIDFQIDDKEVYCVVKDKRRPLVLNVPNTSTNTSTMPSIFPFGVSRSLSRQDDARRKAAYQQQREIEKEKIKQKDLANKKKLVEQAERERKAQAQAQAQAMSRH